MKITKQFNVESAHIVRNCTSHRCSHSIHGHSAVIEVTLESNTLDNAHMVYDFGLMKNSIKSFIDSMDHCYLLCDKDDEEFKNFIKNSCDRWIELPFNPSAEMLSLFILVEINNILSKTKYNNGEGDVKCIEVRYWETKTGSAIADCLDVENILLKKYNDFPVSFSPGVINDWDEGLKKVLIENGSIENPIIEQQINLD